MNTCFNCGIRYYQSEQDPQDGFCSNKCKEEDDARLVEGNGIIAAAEQQETKFTNINKLKLDVHAPAVAKVVQDMKHMNNILGFNRHSNNNTQQNSMLESEKNKYEEDTETI